MPNSLSNSSPSNQHAVILSAAASAGQIAVIRSLLLKGPQSQFGQKPSGDRRDALMNAAMFGHSDAVEMLAPHSNAKAVDSRGMTALMMAALTGNEASVEALIAVSDAAATDDQGATALMYAVASSAPERVLMKIVERLLSRSDPCARDSNGATAADYAWEAGNSECAQWLAALIEGHAALLATKARGR